MPSRVKVCIMQSYLHGLYSFSIASSLQWSQCVILFQPVSFLSSVIHLIFAFVAHIPSHSLFTISLKSYYNGTFLVLPRPKRRLCQDVMEKLTKFKHHENTLSLFLNIWISFFMWPCFIFEYIITSFLSVYFFQPLS